MLGVAGNPPLPMPGIVLSATVSEKSAYLAYLERRWVRGPRDYSEIAPTGERRILPGFAEIVDCPGFRLLSFGKRWSAR